MLTLVRERIFQKVVHTSRLIRPKKYIIIFGSFLVVFGQVGGKIELTLEREAKFAKRGEREEAKIPRDCLLDDVDQNRHEKVKIELPPRQYGVFWKSSPKIAIFWCVF